MNYSEKYVLERQFEGGIWDTLGEFDSDVEAKNALEVVSASGSGCWRVVRVAEVTIAQVSKA